MTRELLLQLAEVEEALAEAAKRYRQGSAKAFAQGPAAFNKFRSGQPDYLGSLVPYEVVARAKASSLRALAEKVGE